MSEQQYSNEGKGALWLKKSKTSDVTYMGGSLEHNGEKIYFKVFKNDRKKDQLAIETDPQEIERLQRLPDYSVLVDQPREDDQVDPSKLPTKAPTVKPVVDEGLPF